MTGLVLGARDPELLARFWCEVLGYVELERDEASIEIGPPGVGFGGPQHTIVFSQTDGPKAGKLRLQIGALRWRQCTRLLGALAHRTSSSGVAWSRIGWRRIDNGLITYICWLA